MYHSNTSHTNNSAMNMSNTNRSYTNTSNTSISCINTSNINTINTSQCFSPSTTTGNTPRWRWSCLALALFATTAMTGHFGRNMATFFDAVSVDDVDVETMIDLAFDRSAAWATDAANSWAGSSTFVWNFDVRWWLYMLWTQNYLGLGGGLVLNKN